MAMIINTTITETNILFHGINKLLNSTMPLNDKWNSIIIIIDTGILYNNDFNPKNELSNNKILLKTSVYLQKFSVFLLNFCNFLFVLNFNFVNLVKYFVKYK